MQTTELFCFAVDALVGVAAEDPACIPLRRFFDREARVLTTMQCYDAALDIFLQDRIDKEKAKSSFRISFEKIEMIAADPEETKRLTQELSLDEARASLIAAVKSLAPSGKAEGFLVTRDTELIAAARRQGIKFHNYTQEEFCAKYGS